jgi:sugar/nucleoside kinase (ribokinase family)
MVIRDSLVTLLTEEEALIFTGQSQADSAAAALLQLGTRYVVLKRGPRGCVVYTAERQVAYDGIRVEARDTTAAGDAFAGGFIVDWLQHGDVYRAAEFANIVGAAKVQKIGSGRQCPTRMEVEALRGRMLTTNRNE